jgi:hypothetical protein
MARHSDSVASAQVVLRPASGQRVTDPITSQNVREIMPSGADAALASGTFERLGFQVGSLVANSFSITGPTALFEKVFKTRLRPETLELPTHALPKQIASIIEAVTFTPPPDFGPANP